MKKVHNNKEVTISESEYLELLKLREEISNIKEENPDIKEEKLVLEQKLSNLLEQLSKFKRDKFGSTSEKVSDEEMEQMSLFFNEIEFTEDQFEKQTEEKEEKTKVKGHDRKKTNRSGVIEGVSLSVILVVSFLDDESQRVCSRWLLTWVELTVTFKLRKSKTSALMKDKKFHLNFNSEYWKTSVYFVVKNSR